MSRPERGIECVASLAGKLSRSRFIVKAGAVRSSQGDRACRSSPTGGAAVGVTGRSLSRYAKGALYRSSSDVHCECEDAPDNLLPLSLQFTHSLAATQLQRAICESRVCLRSLTSIVSHSQNILSLEQIIQEETTRHGVRCRCWCQCRSVARPQ